VTLNGHLNLFSSTVSFGISLAKIGSQGHVFFESRLKRFLQSSTRSGGPDILLNNIPSFFLVISSGFLHGGRGLSISVSPSFRLLSFCNATSPTKTNASDDFNHSW
jgi:hypothetical protein